MSLLSDQVPISQSSQESSAIGRFAGSQDPFIEVSLTEVPRGQSRRPGHEIAIAGEVCHGTLTHVWAVLERPGGPLGPDAGRARSADTTLDLSGVTFIDARGISFLLLLDQRLAMLGGDLYVGSRSRIVDRLLQICELEARFDAPPGDRSRMSVSSMWRAVVARLRPDSRTPTPPTMLGFVGANPDSGRLR